MKIEEEKINLKQSDRHRAECFGMQISSTILRYIFGKIVEEIMNSDFHKDETLRRAFLRGMFAAEGNIAINRKQNYIVYMGLHFSYKKEKHLTEFVKKLLKIEGINSKHIERENKGERFIRITGWGNYYKCWRIDLFHRNLRKEHLFLSKLNKTKFTCKLSQEMLKKLTTNRYLTYRQLSLFIGTSEGTICRFIRNERENINIEYIIELARLASVPLDTIRENMQEFKVRNSTQIDDPEFIDLVLRIKAYS